MVTVKNNKTRLFHFESFGQYKMRVDIGIFKHLSEMTHPNILYIQHIYSMANMQWYKFNGRILHGKFPILSG